MRRKGEGFKKIKQVECEEKRRRFREDKTSGMSGEKEKVSRKLNKWNVRRKRKGFEKIKEVECEEKRRSF